MDNMLISKGEVVLGAPDRANTPRPTHDTRFCQLDVKMTSTELKLYKYKTCYDVKSGVHNI